MTSRARLEVARLLHGRQVTVMPLSLQAISILGDAPEPTSLLVPGGRPRAGEGALTGPLTLTSLSALRFDTAVLGCCGLTAGDGMTAYDLDEAAVKKAVITSARRIIAAADGSKLGRTTHAYVGPSSLVHILVTDTTAPDDRLFDGCRPCVEFEDLPADPGLVEQFSEGGGDVVASDLPVELCRPEGHSAGSRTVEKE
jgi:DeoR/GlpR family transcriptional regulator of sugar metabolism